MIVTNSPFDLVPTVRVRDKSVEGGSRIINRSDLTTSDLIIEDEAEEGADDAPVTGKGKKAKGE